jgi:hypothetical protein
MTIRVRECRCTCVGQLSNDAKEVSAKVGTSWGGYSATARFPITVSPVRRGPNEIAMQVATPVDDRRRERSSTDPDSRDQDGDRRSDRHLPPARWALRQGDPTCRLECRHRLEKKLSRSLTGLRASLHRDLTAVRYLRRLIQSLRAFVDLL